MSEYQKLVASANIGADFIAFAAGNIGQYLIKTASEDEMSALRKLATVNPSEADEIYKLQMEAAIPRRLLEYISVTIEKGNTAKWELEQAEKEF